MEILKVDIENIKPYSRNPRKNEKAVKEVMKSIEKVGYRTPVVVDENMEILVGHTRWKAMKELGHKTLNIIQYKDLTKEQKDDYRILDNKTGEVAEWDFDILMEDFDKDHLLDLGFSIKDLPMDEVVEDEAPPVPEIPKTIKGDLYELGNHRLLCGDSTIITDVEKLMDGQKADMVFTDPPYGVSYQKKTESIANQRKDILPVENDDLKTEDLQQIISLAFSNISISIKDGSPYYIASPQGGELGLMMMMMKDAGIECRHMIIWAKDAPVFSMGRLDYDYQHEPILYGWKKSHKHYGGGKYKTSLWNIARPKQSKLHPTMKPIELVSNAIQNSSKDGDIVLDLFGGSGSTMIASEQNNRNSYLMELSEHYCDVIVQRYVNFTKNTKIKLNGKEIEWPINSTETV